MQHMLGRLLAKATNDVSSQDLHDRALMYHRVLQAGPYIAETVICGSSSQISRGGSFVEQANGVTLDAIGKEFNTLSVVYGQTSDTFITERYRMGECKEELDDVLQGGESGAVASR